MLWRPVVAIGAHDVPEMTFDLTPFLTLLFNGTLPHKLRFNVTDAANPFWVVDGNLKLWLDKDAPANHTFQGKMESFSIPRTVPKDIIQGSMEEELEINTVASKSISASSTFWTSKG